MVMALPILFPLSGYQMVGGCCWQFEGKADVSMGLNCNFAAIARQISSRNKSYTGSERVTGSSLMSLNHFSSLNKCGCDITMEFSNLVDFLTCYI